MEHQRLKNDILNLVEEYYRKEFAPEKFIPGESYIKYAGRVFDERELKNLVEASLDFWLTTGRFSLEFETKFAQIHGSKYCTLTNSGSSANLLAVTALTSPKLGDRRLKPGDEVITVAAGFPTTVAPIIQNNLIPVFVDIELNTLNAMPEQIEAAITSKTRAIFLAHTLGNPFDVEAILKIKNKYELWLIEDTCDALGSKFNEKLVGTFGDLATFSFYPAHHITMGEGGALITDHMQIYRNIKSFRDWGRDCWCEPGTNNTCGKRFHNKFENLPEGYDHKFVYSHLGYNLKLTDMQSAVGLAQLEKLEQFNTKRRKNFKILNDFSTNYNSFFILPESYKGADPSWFGYPLIVRDTSPFKRLDIIEYLNKKKIDTRLLFAGNIIKQPAFGDTKYRAIGDLANTDLVMNNLFWLGVYPGLLEDQMNYVLESLGLFLKDY